MSDDGPAIRSVHHVALDGADVTATIYADGSVRLFVDHPSNDPEVEGRIAWTLIDLLRERKPYHLKSVTWRDDA
jgi:hypothetical protein